ncbi:CoA-binding protein [Ramlibacter albus]|uniref:CoA-binding protein n=1 Tax=Ramlibacter albus TaxID=2079448 RepID=A0A923M8H1_9BURK|nr:CoA-binding protein [Ramlibacter albus]MBC5765768.1 CoA-binding protein [Ramlibacter albus]
MTIDCLLRPRSVAIVGASGNPHKIGGRPLHYMLQQGFAGTLYPVSQRGEPVQGVRSHASLHELPEAPDCVVLSVPAEAAREQLQACAAVGARSAVLFSSGFAELGEAGRAEQRRLAECAADAGLRLLGPNTIGCANFATGAVLSFASIFTGFAPQDGPVAIVSQSGAVGASAYALLRDYGVGVRYFCATGNQADVDVVDFLGAVLADEGVRVVLLYFEEVRSRDSLAAALAHAAARGVPVIALCSARTASGARMADCHTGAAGLRDPGLAELFAAHGCHQVRSVAEMSAAVPLWLTPLTPAAKPPPRVAVISNSGASCVLGADACDAHALPLAQLGSTTRERLDALLPPFSRSRNPVDLTAMLLANPALLEDCVRAVLMDDGCDAAALSLLAIAGPGYDVARFARETAAAMRASGKTLAFSSPDPRVRAQFAAQGIAVFAGEFEALAALATRAPAPP